VTWPARLPLGVSVRCPLREQLPDRVSGRPVRFVLEDVVTPEQRKEELSRAYLHAVAAKCGFALGNWTQDQSCIDVTVGAAGVLGGGSLADPKLDVQLKCTANQTLVRSDHVALLLLIGGPLACRA
jgi:hypothetical protein